MIKINSSRIRYATHHRITLEMELDKRSSRLLSFESRQQLKFCLPKNTLKTVLLNNKTGYNGDDFVKNRKSVVFIYEIITFKRT